MAICRSVAQCMARDNHRSNIADITGNLSSHDGSNSSTDHWTYPVATDSSSTDTETDAAEEDFRTKTVTVVGNGTPSSFALAVDGEIELVGSDPAESAVVVTRSAAEGALDHGALLFQYTGDLTDVTFVNGTASVYSNGRKIDPDQL